MSVESFRNHVVTDDFVGSLDRMSVCDWSVTQLDHDEELGQMHDIHSRYCVQGVAHHQEDRVKSLPMCLLMKSWFLHTSCEKQNEVRWSTSKG